MVSIASSPFAPAADLYPLESPDTAFPQRSRSAPMAQTRKPKPKQGTDRPEPARPGLGTAAKSRQPDESQAGQGAAARRLEEKKRPAHPAGPAWPWARWSPWWRSIVFMGREEPQAENKPVAAEALAAGRAAAGSEGVKTFPWPARTTSAPSSPTYGRPTADLLATTWPAPPARRLRQRAGHAALVHNQEHGYVVILYKGIPADQVDQLRQFVEARDQSKLVLAPGRPGAERVTLTAWQNLETLQRVKMDVVQAFVVDYMVPGATKSTAPEPRAA